MTILVINGPNLNLLGSRETGIYGADTLDSIKHNLTEIATTLDATVDFRQSNHEGEIVDWINQSKDQFNGIIINPAAIASRGRAKFIGLPSKNISPAEGLCTPDMVLMKVDLPAPLSPNKQWHSPGITSSDTPDNAITEPGWKARCSGCSSG